MVRKFIALVSIILIFFCTTSFVNGQGSDLDDVENSLEILTTRIAKLFQNLVLNLEKWLAKLDKHIIGLSGIVIFSCIIFIIGIILLCILAPCVYSVTSCIESCTHCCTGNKETRAMKKNEKFKYFDQRIAALESMNGIKTEIEIVEKDAPPQKSGGDKKAKKRKGKKGATKDEKSVGVSVDGQETNKSVQ